MEPKLPVSHSHNDMADLELFFLSQRGSVVLCGKRVTAIVWSRHQAHSLFFQITYLFSSGVKNLAVEGKSTITDGGCCQSGEGLTRVKGAHTEEGENADGNCRTSIKDLLLINTVSLPMLQLYAQRSRTTLTFQQYRS